jgi:hypothetical protein
VYVSPPLRAFPFYSDYWLIYGLFLEGERTEYDDVGADLDTQLKEYKRKYEQAKMELSM